METEIITKKKDQKTVPVRIAENSIHRKEYYYNRNSLGLLSLKPEKSFWDMLGAFSDQASVEEITKLHYKLRHGKDN